jgi:hypothetical protein
MSDRLSDTLDSIQNSRADTVTSFADGLVKGWSICRIPSIAFSAYCPLNLS